MSNRGAVPPIDVNEWLARFIYYRRHIREDRTVRPDAFIPHPYTELSVTRHLQLSEGRIWELGHGVARQVRHTLRGRADVQVFVCQRQQLSVVEAPLAENFNHANVTGWPAEKPAQKIIAQQIADAAGKALAPPPEETTLASSIDRQTTETGSQSSGIRWIVLLIILAATFVLYWVLNR